MVQLPRKEMGKDAGIVYHQTPIPVVVYESDPKPTVVGLVDALPESFFWRTAKIETRTGPHKPVFYQRIS